MKRLLCALSLVVSTPPAFAILDTNGNGLSDFWERQCNNGNLFDEIFDPQGDPDADGWTNAAEAAAGTNPFDPNPPDGLVRAVTAHIPAVWSEPDEFDQIHLISPEVVTVSWPTLTGKQYSVFFSPDLAAENWLPVDSPFVAQGGESIYHFPVNGSDKVFWRVSVADVDSDQDGLTDHEEFIAGTNPNLADSDGDGVYDRAEFIGNTNPLNQDTDGDGIPDLIDSDLLSSAIAFADADSDGIPDGDDLAPNEARGPAPSIVAENAAGNPLSNLIKNEVVEFLISVANPAGPAPAASDLSLFLNGTEETATFTPLGAPAGSAQRFLLTWVAKTTPSYPALTLQNLSLRFRDSQQATIWLKLARIDVAEWEGMMSIARFRPPYDQISLRIDSHSDGVRQPFHFDHPGANTWYRGPLAIPISHESSPVVSPPLQAATRYPLLFASATGSSPEIETIIDISSPQIYKHHGVFFNSRAGNIEVAYTPGGGATVLPGEFKYLALPVMTHEHPGTSAIFSDAEGPIYDRFLPLREAYGPSRWFEFHSFTTSPPPDEGTFAEESSVLPAYVDFHIRAYPAGPLEHPGLPLPQDCHYGAESAFLAMAPDVWHEIVLKVGPDAQTLSNGIGLWLRKGETQEGDPQSGFTALATDTQGTQTNLTFPPDGKLTIPENSPLWQQLTSSQGLTVFLKLDTAIDGAHELSLNLLPKVESNEPIRLGSLHLLPLEVAPEVLAVNSNFDEGRIDPVTGYAIPDCDDISGVDPKTGAGNSLMALEAVRAHLDGTYTQYQRVTNNLHGGWFGVNPHMLDDDFWDGAAVTIRKIEKVDEETGYPESGQVRFYAKWGEGDYQYYGIEPYKLETLAAVNLTESGINGKPGESVYGSKSNIPANSAFFIEGVRPGKITLEWRYKKGKVELRHEQTFLVATQKSKQEWLDQVFYQVKLQSTQVQAILSDPRHGMAFAHPLGAFPIDLNQYEPANGLFLPASRNYVYLQTVYYYYSQLFAQRPQELYWAGMAKTAGAAVYAGMVDMNTWKISVFVDNVQVDKVLSDFMIQGNKSIFLDQAWAHHAYVSSGIWALQHVRGLQVIDGTSDKPLTDYRAWDGIYEALENEDIGLLREGNQSLLRREQEIVMQPLYEVMKNVWLDPGTELGQYLATGFGGIAYPPVNAAGEINIDEMFSINGRNPVHLIGPKLRDVVPNGKLSSLADRWTWIDNDETGMLQIWLGTSTGLPGFTPANRRNLNSAVFWQHASLYSQLPTNGDFHLDQFPPAW